MTLINQTNIYTPEDLLRLDDAVAYELVGGKLVERNMGLEASKVAATIIMLIRLHLREHKIGSVFSSEASYQCFPDAPGKVRRADVSFISKGRLPDSPLPEGHCRVAPDLAIEVVSPRDLAYDVNEKVNEYLSAGVSLVWVVDPRFRSVTVIRPASSTRGSGNVLTAEDTITGENVLPDFSCKVSQFFE